MARASAVLTGVLIALAFSVWPLRLLNGPCCLGAILAGGVGAALVGRGQGRVLDAVQGFRIGALIGLLAGLASVVLNLVLDFADVGRYALGPVPVYMLAFLEAGWESVVGIAQSGARSGTYGPTLMQKTVVFPVASLLAAGVGGAIAASFFADGNEMPPPLTSQTRPYSSPNP